MHHGASCPCEEDYQLQGRQHYEVGLEGLKFWEVCSFPPTKPLPSPASFLVTQI